MTTPANSEGEKGAFFAQYYGQQVLKSDKFGTKDKLHYLNHTTMSFIEDNYIEPYLLLKPLSSISDEDAVRVCQLFHGFSFEFDDPDSMLYYGKNFASTYCQQRHVADYLRSKSYALPFRQYSVDQMTELGWIKLITK